MSIRRLHHLLPVAGMLLGSLSAIAEDAAAVAAPARRLADLAAAQQLLTQTSAELPAGLPDPFHPGAFSEAASAAGGVIAPGSGGADATAAAARPAGPRSGSDLLAAIGAGLRPSGYFVLGGNPTLVFGQKRVNVGGLLTVNFEGAEYTLEVTAITRTNFTLRLNREEFTRPIK